MLPKEFDVTGKVVLITGAGRGIGSGIAEVLAEAGANVALNALTPTYAEATARAIRERGRLRSEAKPPVVEVFTGDVTQTQDVQSVVQRVLERFGRIDVLVNNLGDAIMEPLVALPETSTRTIDDERLQHILDLNLMATLRCTRAVGPHLLAQRAGKVINIGSYTAARSGARVVVYTAAKAAIEGFTRAQALEWANFNIQVNAIAPGLFPEPRTQGEEGAKAGEQFAARVAPLGRAGRLREVGLLALYLASGASDYMTGQTLYLDGGASIR
ncbi:MAG TPA: SDR family oxidoreductase [Polyangiales bacterium]|nr:SDR family oxidoreductase [Polyangiales bacterium]